MSERKIVKVDEAKIQRMMANDDQSYLTGIITKPIEPEPELSDDSEIVQDSSPEQPKEENPLPETDSGKTPKKRKTPKSDFSELFLKERTVKNRKQIYISVETYDMIHRYLKYIGNVSFIAYVDNILLQHIEEHKDTITELFNKKVSNPF